MSAITYYVVVPFIRNAYMELFGEEAIECRSSEHAISLAGQLSESKAGVIAFARTGDPDLGDFEPAIVLARHGDTPEDME